MNWSSKMNNRIYRVITTCICISALTLLACDDGGNIPPKEAGESIAHNWQRLEVGPEHGPDGYTVSASGLTVPYVVARPAEDGYVHIAHYNAVAGPNDTSYQQLNYLVCNPATGHTSVRVVENKLAYTGVDGFDRCDQFDLALDGTTPVLIYPTYENDTLLQYIEADIMVNLLEGDVWNEYTGAVGYVPRNPVYQDGHVKDNMSMVIDSQGDIHMAYQYFTEGMDSANYRYPDVYYTRRDRATLADPMPDVTAYAAIEEQVDGNSFSTYGVHNSVGYHCKLVLDPVDESPVVVYAEQDEVFDGTFAIKVAYRNASGQWQRETIEALSDGWKVGAISAAFYPPPIPDPDVPVDPDAPAPEQPLAVAYALRSPESHPNDVDSNSHHLKFAVKREGRWTTEIVDERTLCGTHCSLAFTPDGRPAIAYFDEESYTWRPHKYLKYAEFNGIMWEKESAEEQGAVGKFNTLWFDAAGVPTICTYAEEDQKILLIRKLD